MDVSKKSSTQDLKDFDSNKVVPLSSISSSDKPKNLSSIGTYERHLVPVFGQKTGRKNSAVLNALTPILCISLKRLNFSKSSYDKQDLSKYY